MTNYLNQRWTLTFVWLAFFVIVLLLIESYFHVRDADNVPLLLPDDRIDCWKPIRNIYFPYLSGIIAFWFIRPFNAPKNDVAAKQRFILAMVFTIMFNIIIIYFICQTYLASLIDANIVADIQKAVKIGSWFSFIVAPVNAYYFGSKIKV